ncbi:peroxisomal membrane anchor protein conserved region-domain-containing protein [Sporodiniella umbellata]|nr:peroxisomal membrane anchor protein conserved region-domain-containing protein [Sporodiniella umbellata]
MREELITSAISFLSDPKVQSAPLAKKVSFLESKGMTSEEIEEAMSRANGKPSTSVTTTTVSQPGVPARNVVAPPVPMRPSYDWRDIFIAAVLAGGVGFGVWNLAKRLFGPWFKVPTKKEMEEDKEKLDAQFQAVEDSLKEIKDQTNTALTTVSSQSKKIDDSLNGLESILKDIEEADSKRDKEFTNVKNDIDALKELVPKALERNKEAQNSVLTDLQNEMKSLKSLLINRRPPTSDSNTPTTPASPIEGLPPRIAATLGSSGSRAGIPAWQMAASQSSTDTPSSAETPAEKD